VECVCELDSSGPGYGLVTVSSGSGNERSGSMKCSWLRQYATWKVAGSSPDEVTGHFN
jgi:hypothetical protein